MVCLGSEPGPQDGRRRQNHGAMVATPINIVIAFKGSCLNTIKVSNKLKS